MSRDHSPFEVEIDGLTPNGEGLGFLGDKKVLVYGALPGEKVLVKPFSKRRGLIKAEVLEVLQESRERRSPREDHFTSCSPWQILDEEKQLELKQQNFSKLFKSLKNVSEIIPSKQSWNYRNKMEFSLELGGNEKIALALHKRGSHFSFFTFEKCELAHYKINEIGKVVVEELNKKKLDFKTLKNLVVRYSYTTDKCLAILYVKRSDFETFEVESPDLLGWQIIYSDPRSPSLPETQKLLSTGEQTLTEKLGDLNFKYSYNSFFQNNPPGFESLFEFVKENTPKGKNLLDLYCGVGVFALSLSNVFEKVVGVELDEQAIQLAKENAGINNIKNASFFSSPAEKLDLEKFLKESDVLLVDPPRSGLHPRVVKRIKEHGPEHFVYVSCNPSTQSFDMRELELVYNIKKSHLFDLYPQTPHCESVLILERKKHL